MLRSRLKNNVKKNRCNGNWVTYNCLKKEVSSDHLKLADITPIFQKGRQSK